MHHVPHWDGINQTQRVHSDAKHCKCHRDTYRKCKFDGFRVQRVLSVSRIDMTEERTRTFLDSKSMNNVSILTYRTHAFRLLLQRRCDLFQLLLSPDRNKTHRQSFIVCQSTGIPLSRQGEFTSVRTRNDPQRLIHCWSEAELYLSPTVSPRKMF